MVLESVLLHPPSLLKRVLEKIAIRQVSPSDICPPSYLPELYRQYPSLMGDQTAIGPGDDGSCQSWRNNPGWWKIYIE